LIPFAATYWYGDACSVKDALAVVPYPVHMDEIKLPELRYSIAVTEKVDSGCAVARVK
jgi:hypothetical protein